VLQVREDFEYAVVAVDGSALVAGGLIAPGLLAHLPAGLSQIRFSPAGGRRLARFFVLGGVPFGERLLMWWNFVARSGEEITRARDDWAASRFPEVPGYAGQPLAAPALPAVPLRPR
jgi:redox-sensitive bicupin YhaK (pirin superfamily)